jgi:hypothetical protein
MMSMMALMSGMIMGFLVRYLWGNKGVAGMLVGMAGMLIIVMLSVLCGR